MNKKNNDKIAATVKKVGPSVLIAALVVGCVAEEESGKRGDDIVGLELSLSDYRFGVQDVGSQTAQVFELKNIGVDTYPINTISVTGDNAEDFTVDVEEGVTLEPGDKMNLNVAFVPVGEGQRVGSLDIDYSVIEGIGSNLVESQYYKARELEDSGDT
ncbi:MAG: choice-of-anchor D domain-containing protein, partial [Pseudomonadota bacterium]